MKIASLLLAAAALDLHAQQLATIRGLPETRAPAVDIWSADIPGLFANPSVPRWIGRPFVSQTIGGPMVPHWTKESFQIADISVTRPGGGLSISPFPDQKPSSILNESRVLFVCPSNQCCSRPARNFPHENFNTSIRSEPRSRQRSLSLFSLGVCVTSYFCFWF